MYLANTDREMPTDTYDNKELAWYLLSDRIGDTFPEGAPTLTALYRRIGSKLHLSKSDFVLVVRNAVKAGYIIKL